MNRNLLVNLTPQEEEQVVGGIPPTVPYLFSRELMMLKKIRKVFTHKLF